MSSTSDNDAENGAAAGKKKPAAKKAKPGAKSEPKGQGASGQAPAAPGQGRDETDTFIAEVTEELRRDRLFAMFRRYGPYALALIVLMVAAAAVFEYAAVQRVEEARRAGGELIAAGEAEEPAAAYLSAAADVDKGAALLAQLRAAALRAEAGDKATAASIYRSLAVDPDLEPRFRDLALLRAAMVEAETADPQALIDELAPLTAAGAPYRALALEQQAAAYLKLGDVQAARAALNDVLLTPQAPQNLTARAQAVLAALGGVGVPASENDEAAPAQGE